MGNLKPDTKYCKWCSWYIIHKGNYKHIGCKRLHECQCTNHRESMPLYNGYGMAPVGMNKIEILVVG